MIFVIESLHNSLVLTGILIHKGETGAGQVLLRARLVHRALCHSGRESGRELEEPVLLQAWLARRGLRRGHVPVALLRPWHVRQRQLLVHRGLAGRCLRRANKG